MRIVLATIGSDGDLQPFYAFARRLLADGHEVTLAANERYAARARALGIPFVGVAPPWDEGIMRPRVEKILADPAPLRQLDQVVDAFVDEEKASIRGLRSLAQAADVVIHTPFFVAAAAAARIAKIKHVSVHFAPMHKARGYGPNGQNLGAWLNILGWHLAGRMVRSATDSKLNAIVEAVGLPPWKDILLSASHSALLDLIAVSPHVVPKDASWGEATRVCGYWFLDEPEFVPPKPLEDFVSGSEPPVVIGFGSMPAFPADAITKKIVEAVDGLGRRVVLLSGWAGLGKIPLPDHVLAADFVPYGWLFPRAACAVHHGGAGTTAAAFRAGIPQAVVWHLGDQSMWGGKVSQLGVGPQPIFHKKLTPKWLRRQIDTLLSNEGMRERAARLGAVVRAEDGLGEASRALTAVAG
jgi:sterol 3beta-glucosyltransferase